MCTNTTAYNRVRLLGLSFRLIHRLAEKSAPKRNYSVDCKYAMWLFHGLRNMKNFCRFLYLERYTRSSILMYTSNSNVCIIFVSMCMFSAHTVLSSFVDRVWTCVNENWSAAHFFRGFFLCVLKFVSPPRNKIGTPYRVLCGLANSIPFHFKRSFFQFHLACFNEWNRCFLAHRKARKKSQIVVVAVCVRACLCMRVYCIHVRQRVHVKAVVGRRERVRVYVWKRDGYISVCNLKWTAQKLEGKNMVGCIVNWIEKCKKLKEKRWKPEFLANGLMNNRIFQCIENYDNFGIGSWAFFSWWKYKSIVVYEKWAYVYE